MTPKRKHGTSRMQRIQRLPPDRREGYLFQRNEKKILKNSLTEKLKEALAAVAQDVAAFARMEGLTGHAKSATIRTEE